MERRQNKTDNATKKIIEPPESNVAWFKQQGFPKGKHGKQLETVRDIKANGRSLAPTA